MIDSQYEEENYDKSEVKSGGCVSKYCDE